MIGVLAQAPTPTPVDPYAFNGGIISETDDESCDNIYTNNGAADGSDGGQLNCNKASVLILQVPLVETPSDGSAVTYQFTPNGQAGGGQHVTNPDVCAEKGPGYCLYGRPFEIRVVVSKVVTAFDLQEIGIAAPFGYLYENCISKAPANGNTYVPYYSEATCGPADIWDEDDYRTCQDPRSFPYFYGGTNDPELTTFYSKCIFMCAWEVRKQTLYLNTKYGNQKGFGFADWCNDMIDAEVALGSKNIVNVVDSFLQPSTTRNQLGCARAEKYDANMKTTMPNFPMPTGFCPCANSQTNIQKYNAAGNILSPPTPPLVSIVACKSCAGAGSCGSALPVPRPTDPSQCELDTTNQDQDTVCECSLGNPAIGTDSPAEAVNDPNTVCFNTNQNHRCLKCQFDLVDATDNNDKYPQDCAYTDINKFAFCESYWPDICGAGNYGVGSALIVDQVNDASVGMCNCQGVFIEHSYWVAPICAPYRILNPGKPAYAITVELVATDISSETGNVVPGGTMTVGAGWAPWITNAEKGYAEQSLSWLNGTIDGFAVTEILSEYTDSGGYTSNLHGNIVMCNDATGSQGFCSMTSTEDTKSGFLPTADIFTAPDVQGVESPWTIFPPNSTVPLVPLPDFLYKALGEGNVTLETNELKRNANTWWFYLSQSEQDTYGLSCGQNGWVIRGSADTASTTSMCAGPQGTCIPGVDRRLRGEAVQPPCTVAVDFLNYVVEKQGIQLKDQGEAPPHVPFDWDASSPQYYVHRGQMRWTADPLVTNGNMNVRLRISVAADFNGVESAQSSGSVEAVQCFVSTSTTTGIFQVEATNNGDVTSEFVFSQGPECSTGLEIPDYVISLSKGGPTVVNVPIQGTSEYKGGNIANGYCSVSIAPSVLKGTGVVTGSTAQTACTGQYAVPIIVPILSANVTYTEAVFDTAFGNYHNDPDCSGFLCGLAKGWKHGGFLTSAFVWLATIIFTIIVTLLMALCLIVIGKRVNDVSQYRIGLSQGFSNGIRLENLDRLAD